MLITKERLFNNHTIFHIKGKQYKASEDKPQVGDLVIDLQDGCYCVLEEINNNLATVRDLNVVEIGIPIERLVKLQIIKI